MGRAKIKIKTHHEGMQTRMVRSNVDVCFTGGVLNPQPLTSSILTPHGFVKLADVKAGNEVCGLANSVQHVTHCNLEGEKDCIRVTLEDGSSAESALDHKWWILKDGNEMTAISFELLESFEVAQENGWPYDVSIFRYIDGKPVPVRLVNVEDIGKKEVVCLGVSNDDQLYITDDYLITKNCGKAQPLSCRVLTPKGFVKMGDLTPGMEICDTEGGVQEVLQVYEKGEREVYKVSVAGGHTYCCAEHLWEVYDAETYSTSVLTTEQLIQYNERRFYVKCPKAVHFERSEHLLIPPYMLGRLLLDRTVQITKGIYRKLEVLGLTDRDNLFIPPEYILTGIRNRQNLLHGLISCATLHPERNTYDFTAELGGIERGFKALVQSLGGNAVHILRNGRSIFRIYVPDGKIYSDGHSPATTREESCTIYRAIKSIQPAGTQPCRCILVSNPNHLYITDNYIPTHNTYGAILMVAEPSLDPRFRACFTRRNLGNLKAGGGIVDDFKDCYGDYIHVTTSDNPRISFPNGSFVDCLHIADESPDKLMERAKGWQYDMFYLDELTSYEFSTFSIVGTRCRGKAAWTGKIRGSTNPKRKHWVRKMLGWYIGIDGFLDPARDGIVRYYYQAGKDIDGLVWGATKEEVYALCKAEIDRKLKGLGGTGSTYKNLINSFVFYSGKMSENKASLDHNPDYAARVAAVGGARSQQLIEGNWNVDEDEDDSAPIPSAAAQAVFMNDECTNGDKWVTVDLADVGTNNVLALVWDGFHIIDMMFLQSSTPRLNFEKIKILATRHNIPDTHVIYDATRAAYMLDYMPEAVGFISSASPIGMYALMSDRLKDECYLRFCDAVANGRISVAESVAQKRYVVQGVNEDMTFQSEFLEECSVVRFREKPNGKKKLFSKKEMNQFLGKGRSMDVLDPCAMRMYPVLRYQYGEELEATSITKQQNEQEHSAGFNIYEDTNWA